MGKIEEKLESMGITIPAATSPKGNYVSFVRIGNTLHLSGHIPATSKGLIKGKLGADLSVDEGYNSAKTCAINILATLKEELGTLDNVKQI
eukprot:scaffold1413_cov231-Chaetoceros_neogracile.AAC.3